MYTKKITWNVADIFSQIRSIHSAASNPCNDGFSAMGYKKDLFLIKCLVDDLYQNCPEFVGEEIWEEERLITLLKK